MSAFQYANTSKYPHGMSNSKTQAGTSGMLSLLLWSVNTGLGVDGLQTILMGTCQQLTFAAVAVLSCECCMQEAWGVASGLLSCATASMSIKHGCCCKCWRWACYGSVHWLDPMLWVQ